MKIGDKVKARNTLIRFASIGQLGKRVQTWKPLELSVKSGLYLGTTILYSGIVEWSGNEDEGNVFIRTGQIAAVVIQPLDAGNRYRRPVYALAEDVEVVP